MRDRGNVSNQRDFHPNRLQGTDRALSSGPGTSYIDIDTSQTMLLGLSGRALRGELRAEWSALLGTLEADASGARP